MEAAPGTEPPTMSPPPPAKPQVRAGGHVGSGSELTLLDGLRIVPPRVARRFGLIPLRYEADRLIVGARDPDDLRPLETLRRLGHAEVELVKVPEERFEEVMGHWYGPAGSVAELVARLPSREPQEPSVLTAENIESSPAPRFLHLTLKAAIAEGASDVHFEPDPLHPRVRFRVDGILVERVAPPAWLTNRVVGRVKALAGLALGDCLYPQDGAFDFPTPAGPMSMRVSILPTDRGECAVLRLLTVEDDIPTLEALGVPDDVRTALTQAAASSVGLIVVAGPTGSGKTTTLHALLSAVDAERRNIVSIEDPVEIRSRRIRQIAVRREVGLDFAGALRVVLRQDPDVILVGETRDTETAQLVVQAALAGHLVLTTVHAGGALEVFDRFAQLGADRALLAQVTRLALSQRLLRRICPHCQGASCFACEGSGLKGRVGVYEILPMTPPLMDALRESTPPSELFRQARSAGFQNLAERAADLVGGGITTWAEVSGVLDIDGDGSEGASLADGGLPP